MPRPVTSVIVLAVTLTLLACGYLGVFAGWGMSLPAQASFVILILAATLWISEIIPLFVTSFVILALSLTWLRDVLARAGTEVAGGVFLAPFFSDVILLFLGGFVLSAALHKNGFDEQLARWVLARTGSSMPRLVLGIVAVTAFLSMWLSNTATSAMMLALCLPIMRSLPRGDPGRKAILLAVPFSANVGGMGTPIGTPPNAIAIEYLEPMGAAPSFLTWMLMAVPLVLVMLVAIWGVLLLMFRSRVERVELPPPTRTPTRSLGSNSVIVVAGVTILGWLTASVHGLSAGTIALIPILVLFGGRILDVRDLKSLSWDVLLVMGGGLCLGQGIAVSGLAEWMVAGVPTEGLGIAVLCAAFGIAACLMSLVMSNTAAANLLMPIVIGLGVSAVSPLIVSVAFCCALAMAMPISTPPNAIAFGSGELTVMDLLKPGLILTVLGVTLTLTVGNWWWDLVGLY